MAQDHSHMPVGRDAPSWEVHKAQNWLLFQDSSISRVNSVLVHLVHLVCMEYIPVRECTWPVFENGAIVSWSSWIFKILLCINFQ